MKKSTKILLTTCVTLTVIVAFLILLPFMINLSRFKPQIQSIFSEKLNAKIEYSKAKLTILSGLGFEIDDVILNNTNKNTLYEYSVKVKNIKLNINILPLFKRKIEGKIKIDNPEIVLIREEESKNIVEDVQKQIENNKIDNNNSEINEKSSSQKLTTNSTTSDIKNESENNINFDFIDNILIRNLEIQNLSLVVKSKSISSNNEIKLTNLNLKVFDIINKQKATILLSTILDYNNNDTKISGPIDIDISADSTFEENKFKKAMLEGLINLSRLKISVGNIINKPDTVPIVFNFKADMTENNLSLNTFYLDNTLLFINVNSDKPLIKGESLKINGNLNSRLKSITISKFDFNNLDVSASFENNIVSVQKLNFDVFSGVLNSNAEININEKPYLHSGNMALKKVKLEKFINFIQTSNSASPIEGQADISLKFKAKGASLEEITNSLYSSGSYVISDGTLNTKSLVDISTKQFNQFISNISSKSLSIDLGSFKKIQLSEEDTQNRKIQLINGDFYIRNSRLYLKNTLANENGELSYNTSVGFNETLEGTASYVASNKVKEKLIEQSKYASYLLNEKGDLILNLKLSGSIREPQVAVDTATLQERLLSNSGKHVINKINEEINKNSHAQKIRDDAKKILEKNGINLKKFGF